MQKLLRSRSKKRGLPPGTPVYIGEKKLETPQVPETQQKSDIQLFSGWLGW